MSLKNYLLFHWSALSFMTDWNYLALGRLLFNFVIVKSLAGELKSKAQSLGLTSEVLDLKNYEPEDSLSEEVTTYFGNAYMIKQYM